MLATGRLIRRLVLALRLYMRYVRRLAGRQRSIAKGFVAPMGILGKV